MYNEINGVLILFKSSLNYSKRSRIPEIIQAQKHKFNDLNYLAIIIIVLYGLVCYYLTILC
jgi:hypothetical protein